MRKDRKPVFTNRPKHIFVDNSYYFITVRCTDRQWYMRENKFKQVLKEKLIEKTKKFKYSLIAYAIVQNHYHILIKVLDSSLLTKFMNELNGASSKSMNDLECVIGRKVWWNYFDHIIRDEEDFYKHLNYIHQNPIKHGASKTFEYEFSSYNSWVTQKGKEYMDHAFEKYPIIDFAAYNDEF